MKLSHQQEMLLMRSLLAAAMRRLKIDILDVDTKEFEARHANDVELTCYKRPGGGFVVTLVDNVIVPEKN